MNSNIRNSLAGHGADDPFASPGAQPPADWSQRMRHSKALFPALGILLVAVGALGATLVVKHHDDAALDTPVALASPSTGAPLDPVRSPTSTMPANTTPTPPVTPVIAPVRSPVAQAPVAPAVCSSCGTIESVVAVQRTQKASGVGAIGGAVVGGLLGNQIGGGSGRTAMTLLGAGGGAYAGNAIEKNMHRYTVYETRVRMEDGTLRTFERSSRMATGSRVIVEGQSLRLA